jgi:hypothetical protein
MSPLTSVLTSTPQHPNTPTPYSPSPPHPLTPSPPHLLLAAAVALSATLCSPANAALYTVTGQVLLPSKKPAGGARVWLRWGTTGRGGSFVEGKAAADGRFRLPLKAEKPAYLVLGGAAAGAAPAWRRVQLASKIPPVNFMLPEPVILSGRLIRTNGTGAPGIQVAVDQLKPPGPPKPGIDALMRAESMIPRSVLQSLAASSGPDGRFRITGLPPTHEARLVFRGEILLSEGTVRAPTAPSVSGGSEGPAPVSLEFRLGPAGTQELGLLVAVRPARIEVQVRTPEGQPLPGAPVSVRRLTTRPEDSPSGAAGGATPESTAGGPVPTDPRGILLLQDLHPGKYEVAFLGGVRTVDVAEGASIGPIHLAARNGPLKGRITDAAGKPVPGARIAVDIGRPKVDWPPGPQKAVAAGEEGAFEIPDFPWGASLVVVRAQAGNALGEWVGDPSTLDGSLSLPLQTGALINVRGRALGLSGDPLGGATVVLWTGGEGDLKALSVGMTDREGRFEFGGVRRGIQVGVAAVEGAQSLRSASCSTPAEGDTLELGDLKLTPPAGQAARTRPKVQDLVAQAFAPAPIPSTEDLTRVGDLAWTYLQAVLAGDVRRLHQLTSTRSPGFEPDLASFLRKQSLVLPPEAARLRRESLHALPVVPRLIFLLAFGFSADPEKLESTLAVLDTPDWSVAGYRGAEGIDLLIVAHRDADGWKVVGGIQSEAGGIRTTSGDGALFGVAYRAPAPEPVLAAAQAYLSAWGRGDLAAVRNLTSPNATEYEAALAGFRQKWAARPDAGKYPAGDQAPTLQLDSRFSAWDLALLFAYPRLAAQLRQGVGFRSPSLAEFPFPEVKGGHVAVVRYKASEKHYLMLLVRRQNRWEVLEPALPG